MNSHPSDLRHIFWGDTSWTLIAEIALRVVAMFVYALFLLRFISRRGFGSLSLFEIIIIVALGSAVGDPMLNPDVPLMRGFTVITVVILAMRATVYFVSLSRKATDVIEGTACRIIHERRLDWKGIKKVSYSREEVAMQLRIGGIKHLGQVKGAYVEANGEVSIFCYAEEKVRSGLPLFPPWDVEQPHFVHSGMISKESADYSCRHCGHTISIAAGSPLSACPHCGRDKWVFAWGYDERTEEKEAEQQSY